MIINDNTVVSDEFLVYYRNNLWHFCWQNFKGGGAESKMPHDVC